METLILAAIFLAIAGLLIGAYLYTNRRTLEESATIRARIHGRNDGAEERSILKDTRASQLPFLDRILQGKGLTESIRVRLAQAGSTQTPGVFLLAAAVAAGVGLVALSFAGAILGIPLLVVCLAIPWIWLSMARKRRLAAFEEKFPDALDMMANSMRAGYSFQAAANFIGDEMEAPVGPEFARFYEEQRLGVDVRAALLGIQERVDSLNVKMFVTAVLIQRETGGNLTELLGNLSTLMRDRTAVQGQIETLTAEPKLSGRILAAMPVVIFLMLSRLAPDLMAPFVGSSVGKLLLAATAVSVVVGYIMLMKIADVDM